MKPSQFVQLMAPVHEESVSSPRASNSLPSTEEHNIFFIRKKEGRPVSTGTICARASPSGIIVGEKKDEQLPRREPALHVEVLPPAPAGGFEQTSGRGEDEERRGNEKTKVSTQVPPPIPQ